MTTTMKGYRYLESREVWNNQDRTSRGSVVHFLARIGNPQDRPNVIHIAGTNGKGSVAFGLARLLSKSGHSVGLNTSPHLNNLEERVCIDGRLITKQKLNIVLLLIQKIAESGEITLTYHEVLTLAAIILFRKLDWAVYETGLGGRHDASNVFKCPKLTVITTIGLDHQHVLGDTVEKIAEEKFAIIRHGTSVVSGITQKGLQERLRQITQENKSVLVIVPQPDGCYQVHNLNICRAAAKLIGLPDKLIETGLDIRGWPGRLESIGYRGKEFLLDAAHNQAGTVELLRYLRKNYPKSRIGIVFGVLSSKDYKTSLNLLAEVADRWYLTEPRSDLAVPAQSLREHLNSWCSATCYDDYQELINDAVAEPLDLIVVCGSIYLLAHVRAIMLGPVRQFY